MKSMKRLFLFGAAALVTIAGAWAAQRQLKTSEPLEAALSAIREGTLMGDLFFLASDELGGRDTPSPGLRIAALYLRSRLERLGLSPGAEDGWFHEYALGHRKLDTESSRVELTSANGAARLVFGEHYFLERPSHLADFDVVADVVSVGEGDARDFESAELEGRWALLFTHGRSTRKAVQRAVEGGAVGLIVTPGTDYEKEPFAEKYARTMRFLEAGTTTNPDSKRKFHPPELPVVMLTRTAAANLRTLAENPWEDANAPPGHVLGISAHETRAAKGTEFTVANVCAFWPGSDPELAQETIVLSAHYDHVGERPDRIYNGADDNASGTTGLLGVAEALVAYGPMRRSVLLLWVSGEEKGLWGSAAWTKNPWLPGDCRPVANLNIDMIGRTAPTELYITPSDAHERYNGIAQLAYELAPLEGFPSLASQDEFWSRSDHANFARHLEIPVAFLSCGEHPDYHKPTDTADKIDFEKLKRVTRLLVRMLHGLQETSLE